MTILPIDAARARCTREGRERSPPSPFRRFAIDSRRIAAGESTLFFALRGPNHDGHDFVRGAVAAGAAGVVVSREDALEGVGGARLRGRRHDARPPGPRPFDPSALRPGRRDHRQRRQDHGQEMTAAVLAARRPTGRSAGNLNNTYGLPLTLLNQPEDARAVVLEMGMSTPGEIARLAEIADPDVGVV
jgi:UDP-N-acetylmuramoyl-tripeptide--D-alanyl-D-alanine ligase